MPWSEEMTKELKHVFDSNTTKRITDECTREEILKIAEQCGEVAEELEDQIDLLAFDEETGLLGWDEFYEWWSETVDPRDYEEAES
jgi:hypothetical protein